MLKKVCHACNRSRKKGKLLYDKQFNAYCQKAHECNELHPNSTVNLIRNGKETLLTPHDEAIQRFTTTNTASTVKLLEIPITIRLSDAKQAEYIANQCAKLNMNTSQFMRHLIEQAMTAFDAAETITEATATETPPPNDFTF